MTQQSSTRLLTLVTPEYLPGFLTLAYSLAVNGGSQITSLTVVHDGKVPRRVTRRVRSFGLECEYVDSRALGDVSSPVRQKQPRLDFAFKKLALLKYPHDGTICFIDADMLCLNPLDGVEELGHLSAAPDRGAREPRRIVDRPMFNTGFLVFRPSEELFQAVYDYALTTERPIHQLADQSVLNWYFYETDPDAVHLLDHDWNTLKRVYHHQPELFDLQKIRLLHFVGPKPWDGEAHDQGEATYHELRKLWWSSFSAAGGPALFPDVEPP